MNPQDPNNPNQTVPPTSPGPIDTQPPAPVSTGTGQAFEPFGTGPQVPTPAPAADNPAASSQFNFDSSTNNINNNQPFEPAVPSANPFNLTPSMSAPPQYSQSNLPPPSPIPSGTGQASVPSGAGQVPVEPMPTWTPPQPPAMQSPAGFMPEVGSVPMGSEPAPTNLSDLSNPLLTNNTPQPIPVQSETIVMPTNLEATQEVTGNGSRGFPKWILLVGFLLVLVVGGASAYFILGIGQTKQAPPVEQQPESAPNEIVMPSPIVTLQPTIASISAAPSQTGTSSGTTAIDLLRQRQQSQ